jgi:uncharacterized protein
MIWFTSLLAFILILLLISSVPLRTFAVRFSIVHSKTLRRGWRSTYYLGNMLITWLLVFLLTVLCFELHWSTQMLGLRSPTHIFLAGIFFGVFTLFILALIVSQRWLAQKILAGDLPWSKNSASRWTPLSLPGSTQERFHFAAFALTAGFCEELLYRGFLPLYLTQIFPRLPFVWAMLAAALVFGVAHIQQREINVKMFVVVLSNGVMGFVYGFIYISISSIFLPMILHALFDLRALLFINTDQLYQAKKPGEESASLFL